MTWITTADGRDYHLAGPAMAGNVYQIDTIAQALAQINRFTGHTRRPYSVAEHSVVVAQFLLHKGHSTEVQLAGLMHDAHEAYVGDVASPIKQVLGTAWATFEAEHEAALRKWFGLTDTFARYAADIKKADLEALALERMHLLNHTHACAPWPVLDTPGHEVLVHKWQLPSTPPTWKQAAQAFCAAFDMLAEHR